MSDAMTRAEDLMKLRYTAAHTAAASLQNIRQIDVQLADLGLELGADVCTEVKFRQGAQDDMIMDALFTDAQLSGEGQR